MSRSTDPSRGALATKSAPITPAAPALFSTMTGMSRRCPSGAASARAMTSLLPPGENGTTILICFGIGACAAAIEDMPSNVVMPHRIRNSRRRISASAKVLQRQNASRPAHFSLRGPQGDRCTAVTLLLSAGRRTSALACVLFASSAPTGISDLRRYASRVSGSASPPHRITLPPTRAATTSARCRSARTRRPARSVGRPRTSSTCCWRRVSLACR